MVATSLGLIASIIIARVYSVEMVGILAMIQAFMMFSTLTTLMGTNTSILRLIPEHVAKYSVTSAYKVYKKTQYFVGSTSILAGVLLFLSADLVASQVFSKPHLSPYFSLAACFVFFKSLMDLNTKAVRGLRLIKAFAWMQALPSATFLLSLVFLSLVHGSTDNPVYARLASWVITAIVGAWIMDYVFRKRLGRDDLVQPMPLRDILRISTPMLMTASMQFIIGQTGVILLGIFRSEAEVGYYSVAVKLALLTTFILSAINSMAAPKFSELYHIGAIDDLFHVAQKSTRMIFWTTVPVLLFLLILGWPLLGFLYGWDFTIAYPAMVLLVMGQFLNSISGSTGYFMQMTGHQKTFRNVMLAAGLLNITIGIVLVPSYGIVGAAFSAMVCVGFWNIYSLVFIKREFGRTIGYFPLFLGRG